MKTCKSCAKSLPFDAFYKRADKPGAYISNCKACEKARVSVWAKSNPDNRKATTDKYRKANREKCNQASMASIRSRPEVQRAWQLANLEKVRKAKRDWVKRNPEAMREAQLSNKGARRGAEGSFTEADIKRICEAQKGKCAVCRVKLVGLFHRDHIQPIVLGGSNWPWNIQLLCSPCNLSKSAKHPVDFMQSRGFLL